MQTYELMYILDPEVTPEQLEEDRAAHKDFLEKTGATEMQVTDMGKRKLAYVIKHRAEGIYTLVTFQAEPAAAHVIKEKFPTLPRVLRHMVVKAEG